MRNPGRYFFILFLAICLPASAHMPDLTLEQTIRAIYAPYAGDSDPPRFDETGEQQIVSSRLLTVLKKNQRLTPVGDVGAIDWDPLCGCQDYEQLAVRRIDIQPSAEDRAAARVTISPFGKQPEVTLIDLRFVREQGRWLIDDVISAKESLFQLVDSNNQAIERQLNALQRPAPDAFIREVYTSRNFDTFSWPLLLTPAASRTVDAFFNVVSTMSDEEQESQSLPLSGSDTPLCGCSAPNSTMLSEVTIAEASAERAQVTLHFILPDGKPDARTVVLIKGDGRWQIDDILQPDGESLMQRLRQVTESAAAAAEAGSRPADPDARF